MYTSSLAPDKEDSSQPVLSVVCLHYKYESWKAGINITVRREHYGEALGHLH